MSRKSIPDVLEAIARLETVTRSEVLTMRAQLNVLQGLLVAVNSKLDTMVEALAEEEGKPVPPEGLDAASDGQEKASQEL